MVLCASLRPDDCVPVVSIDVHKLLKVHIFNFLASFETTAIHLLPRISSPFLRPSLRVARIPVCCWRNEMDDTTIQAMTQQPRSLTWHSPTPPSQRYLLRSYRPAMSVDRMTLNKELQQFGYLN
jgi:hypothetical protein